MRRGSATVARFGDDAIGFCDGDARFAMVRRGLATVRRGMATVRLGL